MINFLVETKNEYTTHLINIITPLIFEGLQSVYKQSIKVSEPNEILKHFQSFLKMIPKWNQSMIDVETNRIINSSNSYNWLNDLIKATLKSHYVVLTYNPTRKVQEKIDPSFYQNIKTSDFIHKVYIECARELWNNPYLLYHNYPPIEIKRNQRDCMAIIKDCIKEAIRKLLPVKHILQIYLGEEVENNIEDDIDKILSEVDERNLTGMIKKELNENNDMSFNIPSTIKKELNNNKLIEYKSVPPSSLSDEKTIGSRILNIMKPVNKTSETSSEMNNIIFSNFDNTNKSTVKSSKNNSSTSITNIESSSKKSKNHNNNNNIDSKIKKILENDLATNDSETSLINNNNNFQEVFSNSNKDSVTDKKFFNNYLKL
jgi:hypothetical protein